jgi:hypothetical protein
MKNTIVYWIQFFYESGTASAGKADRAETA